MYTEKQMTYDEVANLIKDGKRKEIEAFYTGGGIWLSAVYLSDTIYAVTSNDEPTTLTYYDVTLDEEEGFSVEDYGDYPCFAWIRSVGEAPIGSDYDVELAPQDKELLEELQTALRKEISRFERSLHG